MGEGRESSTWSGLAPWYDQLIAAGSGPHETAVACLLRLAPDVAGRTVLDVACGQGLATRALMNAGAEWVVGVDSSPAMIDAAAARTTTDAPIGWCVDDAQGLATFDAESFDGVTCQLGLMDIPDLASTLSSIRRVLRPRGWFVFVIGHPCFLAPGATTTRDHDERLGRFIGRYLDEEFWRASDSNGVRARAGNYHRPLSTYLNGLLAAGFRLDAVDEPAATPRLVEQQPVYRHLPIFFGARATAA